jgi:hypothetical protein
MSISGKPAISDGAHHKIGRQRSAAAAANHVAVGIDHGPLDLNSGHPIITNDHGWPAPEMKRDALRKHR